MPITPPTFGFDPKKVRTQAILDNYGMPDLPMGITESDEPDPFAPQEFSVKPPSGGITPDVQNMMDSLATPQQDAYNRILSQRPEREDPGLLRKIVAAGMSVGAHPGDVRDPLGTQESVMFAPHRRAMEDWTSQVEPAYRSAQLENTANANERQARTSILTNKTNMDRYADINEQATRKNDITEQRNKDLKSIADRKNEIETMWRLGYKFEKNGNDLVATRPDGTHFVAETNLEFSPLALERLRQDGRMAAIDNRGQEARETKQTAPAVNPNSPGGLKADENKRNDVLRRAYDTPGTRNLVKPPTTANGLWELVPPKKPFWGSIDPTELANYNKIYQEIYGAAPLNPEAPVASHETAPAPPPVPQAGLGPSAPPEPRRPNMMDQRAAMGKGADFIGPSEFEQPKGLDYLGTGGGPTSGGRAAAYAKFQEEQRNKPATPPPQTANSAATIGPGEVMVQDLQTGKYFAMRKENVERAVATGRYKVQ